MTELVNCKFCGGVPWYESELIWSGDNSEVGTYLECSKCRATTKTFAETPDAEKAWNAGDTVERKWRR